MPLDRRQTATALLVTVVTFRYVFGGTPIPDSYLWYVFSLILVFGAIVFLIGVEYGIYYEQR